jgi:di/tricarboxylate transporter
MDIWIVTILLIVTLFLLITETLPLALTSVGILVLLVLTGVLTPEEAVKGFSNPAVITVGGMFIISRGIMKTGGVEYLGRRVVRMAKGSATRALVIVLCMVALASAFINNTPVVLLFIPVVMTMCCEFDLSPSRFLIPVSYASILAGTCTLIGTSTNIIISNLSVGYGLAPIGMFELARIGVPIAVLGILFLLVASPVLMPSLLNPVCHTRDNDHRQYLAELKIPRNSRLIGSDALTVFKKNHPGLNVLELIRYSHIFHPERDTITISADDLLLVKGSLNDLVEILQHEDVELPMTEKGLSFGNNRMEPIVVELIVSPQSSMAGQRLLETDLMQDPDIHVIALKRSNLHYTERQIHDARLKIGDVVLVWLSSRKLETLRNEKNYLVIESVSETIVLKRKALLAMTIFTGMIVAASTGMADIMICALGAAFLMILTGCIQMREAFRALQGNVLILIAGTIALGTAMEKTGASRVYATAFLQLFSGMSPRVILGGVILLTSISTQLLSNNATAVLLLPMAISTAAGLGLDPRPFVIAVCIGASACFATPIGYQTNLMVHGPGGYRFMDYLKMGIPLNLFVLIMGTLFIPIFWPF